MLSDAKIRRRAEKNGARYTDAKSALKGGAKKTLLNVFRFVLLAGISYVILAPVIGIVSRSFFSNQDAYNPMVFTIPMAPTLERYQRAIARMNYFKTVFI